MCNSVFFCIPCLCGAIGEQSEPLLESGMEKLLCMAVSAMYMAICI